MAINRNVRIERSVLKEYEMKHSKADFILKHHIYTSETNTYCKMKHSTIW
jgi:hypothetical protein